MGLTNKELLENIESIFEKKFSEKFALLASEIDSLKQTNADLININKALIALIKSSAPVCRLMLTM